MAVTRSRQLAPESCNLDRFIINLFIFAGYFYSNVGNLINQFKWNGESAIRVGFWSYLVKFYFLGLDKLRICEEA